MSVSKTYYLCACVSTWLYVYMHICECVWRPEDSTGSPRTVVVGIYGMQHSVLLHESSRMQTLILMISQ